MTRLHLSQPTYISYSVLWEIQLRDRNLNVWLIVMGLITLSTLLVLRMMELCWHNVCTLIFLSFSLLSYLPFPLLFPPLYVYLFISNYFVPPLCLASVSPPRLNVAVSPQCSTSVSASACLLQCCCSVSTMP